MKPHIHLLTGPIQTGKSHHLLRWSVGRDACGFLTPTIGERKQFFNVAERTYHPYESQTPGTDTQSVGRFHLLQSAFESGLVLARGAILNQPEVFLFDEWGRLEREGDGFKPAFDVLLNGFRGQLLVVVRELLAPAFREQYRSKIVQEIPFLEWKEGKQTLRLS